MSRTARFHPDDEVLAAIQEGTGFRECERRFGCSFSRYTRLKRLLAFSGHAPEHDFNKPLPPGFVLRRHSQHYDAEGNPGQKWVISSPDMEQRWEMIQEAMRASALEIPRASKVPKPRRCDEDLLAVYPMGDPHFGMYSWAEETGADFDLDIAERQLCGAMDYLVDIAPPANTGLIINLGDFFHVDNLRNATSRSGNVLDVDTRLPKMISIGVRALRTCIHRALQKHARVEVINAIGNHDDVLSMAMSILLKNVYEKEPRITIHSQPTTRHYVQHGKVLIGAVHGHDTKDKDLPAIMASERAQMWGATTRRYWYRGHHHQDRVEEFHGCTVEQFRTLAPRDAWATSKGYFAGQDMKVITHHRDYGEVGRARFDIAMLRAA